ncbi:MAG: CapA family protein [Tyzzerella sp.]|nr:CapA family protein [Tyzzerella sp.]
MTKKVKNTIVISGFILIAIIIFAMIKLTSLVKNAEKEASQTVENTQAEDLPEVIIETKKDIQITISAAGDCTFATDVNYAGGPTFVAKYNEVQDPSYFLAGVQSVFANDDLTIVNFEGTLTNLDTRQEKEFAFRGDPEYIQILTSGSVEAVNLANNHSRDYGMQSLEDTKQYLTEAGVTHFGYEETAIYECKGVKIGLIGIYVLPDGLGRMQQLKDHIQKVKSEGAVITIVNFHWGIEREYYPNDVQKQLAHAAIDNGADLVIGEHPHVLQGIETYNGKKIVYSMGNFCFGGNKNPSDKDSMIFQQTFTIRDGEILSYDDFNVIPCSISSVTNVNDYQPTILEGAEAERVMNKIDEISAGLSQ